MRTDASRREVGDEELKKVIADFLDMGHVDNIVAMFKQEPRYHAWVGELLHDRRFAVRLGVSVLFEELKAQRPEEIALAENGLIAALASELAQVRGEAVSVLGIIGTARAIEHVRRHLDDPAPEVAEVARDVLDEA